MKTCRLPAPMRNLAAELRRFQAFRRGIARSPLCAPFRGRANVSRSDIDWIEGAGVYVNLHSASKELLYRSALHQLAFSFPIPIIVKSCDPIILGWAAMVLVAFALIAAPVPACPLPSGKRRSASCFALRAVHNVSLIQIHPERCGPQC
jgi:hypothetical protein